MKNKVLRIVGLAIMIMAIVVPGVMAAEQETPSAQIELQAGNRNVFTSVVDFAYDAAGALQGPAEDGIHVLTGSDLTVNTRPLTAWAAEDATGSGAGWHVNVISSDFEEALNPGDPLYTITADNLMMHIDSVSGVGGTVSAPPTSLHLDGDWVALDASAKFLSAALNEGMGKYEFTPDFSLMIPASAMAGSYSATLTVDIVAAP